MEGVGGAADERRLLKGSERIHGTGGFTVGDFWAWAQSDLLSNTTRCSLAEFLVAAALKVTDRPRIEWDAVDLRCNGITIEVKSTGLVQSWHSERPSAVARNLGSVSTRTRWLRQGASTMRSGAPVRRRNAA